MLVYWILGIRERKKKKRIPRFLTQVIGMVELSFADMGSTARKNIFGAEPWTWYVWDVYYTRGWVRRKIPGNSWIYPSGVQWNTKLTINIEDLWVYKCFLNHEIWLQHQGTECRFKWEDIQDWLKIRSQGDESEKPKKKKLNQRSLKNIIEEKLGGSFRFSFYSELYK